MPFIGRLPDQTIYGCWTVRQWRDQEELPDDHPDVLAFLARRLPVTQRQLDLTETAAKIDSALSSALVPQPIKDLLASLKKVLT